MTWWLWVLLGFFLLIVELVTPGGFYILFFGIGAIIVGTLDSLGLAGPDWMQWLLFSVLSVGCLLIFRRPLMRKLRPSRADRPVDSLVGETAQAMEDIPAGGQGKAELRGASWNARNTGQQALLRGQRCQVDKVEGLVLWVHRLD
jgi:membrane protein implicated in regulation of membrane protease activity